MTSSESPQRRHTAGVVIVASLGALFFVLLALLVFSGGKHRPAPTTAENETFTVLPASIRLRTEPNAKAPVVATAAAGQTLDKLEERGAWVHVKDGDGLTGWAERGMLERTAERERRLARFAAIRGLPPLRGVVTRRTSLYSGPGIFYPIVGDLVPGRGVQVFTRDHDFYAIPFLDGIAYADIDSVDVTASGGSQFEVTPSSVAATEPPAVASREPTHAASAEPQPPLEPSQPAPEPTRDVTEPGRIYSVVPPGGTSPVVLEKQLPRYPETARRARVGGFVVVRDIVRRDGTIDAVEVIRDRPYGLGEAARSAVERWRFRPATFHGEPIDVYHTVTLEFRTP